MKIIVFLTCVACIMETNGQFGSDMICHIIDKVLMVMMCMDNETGENMVGQLSKCLGGPVETMLDNECEGGILSLKASQCFNKITSPEKDYTKIMTKCINEIKTQAEEL